VVAGRHGRAQRCRPQTIRRRPQRQPGDTRRSSTNPRPSSRSPPSQGATASPGGRVQQAFTTAYDHPHARLGNRASGMPDRSSRQPADAVHAAGDGTVRGKPPDNFEGDPTTCGARWPPNRPGEALSLRVPLGHKHPLANRPRGGAGHDQPGTAEQPTRFVAAQRATRFCSGAGCRGRQRAVDMIRAAEHTGWIVLLRVGAVVLRCGKLVMRGVQRGSSGWHPGPAQAPQGACACSGAM
jgi:hypothetical protein